MGEKFKIHSICLSKNEGDIIGPCLREATKWSDYIYVYDGQSTDQTWDVVNELHREFPQIIPWKQDGKVFREALRAEVFNTFRKNSTEGDWWCQLNADEFYVEEPRAFLEEITWPYHAVWANGIWFYITEEDVNAIDFTQPVMTVLPQLKYYQVWQSERRFFRDRRRLRWDEDKAWPYHLGCVWPKRLNFRHYPYRSPEQIQKRLDVRRDNRQRGFEGWDHAKEATWKEKIEPRSKCIFHQEGSGFVIDESKLPSYKDPFWLLPIKQVLHRTTIWP
jgi:hypothetical protein